MRKFLVIFLISTIFLFFGIGLVRGAGLCEVCDGEPCDSGLRCLEGVCQPTNRVVFCPPTTYKTFDELVTAIISFIFTIAVVVTPLMIIIGAFYLLTAAGDPKRVETGKTIISYALIGLVVILLARAIIYVIKSAIGVK